MNDTVLITGVGGFLGRYAARGFARLGARVVGVDALPPENAQIPGLTAYRQIRMPGTAFAEAVCKWQPGACVHCAGRASVPLSFTDGAGDYLGNTHLTFEVLETLRLHRPGCRFLLLSSAAVYGNPTTLPVTESAPVAPLSPYGLHKRQAELLCEEYAAYHGVPTAALRVFSAYGPGLRRQVVWDICERTLSGQPFTLHGTGAESRDFVHAADVADAMAAVVEHGTFTGEIYNVGAGAEVTIRELADLLVAALSGPYPPTFSGLSRTGDPLRWQAATARIHSLGWTPRVPLTEGLRATAHWCALELGGPLQR
jgi:UDP-glucose 4-epimerase